MSADGSTPAPDETIAIAWRCEQLIRRAVMLSDLGRWSELAELYTEDARMSRPSDPDRWIVGRTAILESFLARPLRTSRHLIGNVVVDVRCRSEARALTTVALYSGPAAADGVRVRTDSPVLIGAFEDVLRCEVGVWRIARRAGSLTLQHGGAEVAAAHDQPTLSAGGPPAAGTAQTPEVRLAEPPPRRGA